MTHTLGLETKLTWGPPPTTCLGRVLRSQLLYPPLALLQPFAWEGLECAWGGLGGACALHASSQGAESWGTPEGLQCLRSIPMLEGMQH